MLSDSFPWFVFAGLLAGLLAAMATGCLAASHDAGAKPAPALKEAFKSDFLIGAALNAAQTSGRNPREVALIQAQFNSISPENVLKWGRIHPRPDTYNFEPADQYVEFGRTNNMFIIGHTLVWHQQTPRWVFQDAQGNPVDRDSLMNRLREHISTVVGRYRGKIGGWDVVNEALNEDGTLRPSPWLTILGEDYLIKAFQFAHEADPNAELYYNDYSLENPRKRKGAVALIKKLQAQGARVAGVGLQGHYQMKWPSASQLNKTIEAFGALGLKVMVTELDVDVLPRPTRSHEAEVSMNFHPDAKLNPYTNGLPAAVQKALADRYADLFAVFADNRKFVDRVTFWGLTDASSWLNNWPVRGRTSHPLLFDRDGKPKPAYDAVLQTALKKKSR